MAKKIVIIGFLLLGVAFNASANDSDRIDKLEKQIQEINLRLSKLESLLSNPSKAQERVTPSEGWKSVSNWRKLQTGMSTSDVRSILGAPERVKGGLITLWYYPHEGKVTFTDGKVFQWKEPVVE